MREFIKIRKTIVVLAILLMAACSDKNEAASVANEKVPDFSAFTDVNKKKAAFFDFFYPIVFAENERVRNEREFIESLVVKLDNDTNFTSDDINRATKLGSQYKNKLTDAGINSEWVNAMLIKVDYIPAPLVLTQAANESAWGTSRFAREANNYFGQWCFKKGCGLIPTNRSEGAKHEVAKFSSPSASVRAYFMNINSHAAYADVRNIRMRLHASAEPLLPAEDALMLAHGLKSYSERGDAYVEEIQAMIRHNRKYWKYNQ